MAAVEVAHACHTQAIHGETERGVGTLGRHELMILRQTLVGGEQFLSVQIEESSVFVRLHMFLQADQRQVCILSDLSCSESPRPHGEAGETPTLRSTSTHVITYSILNATLYT
jgi:hypothetical protein